MWPGATNSKWAVFCRYADDSSAEALQSLIGSLYALKEGRKSIAASLSQFLFGLMEECKATATSSGESSPGNSTRRLSEEILSLALICLWPAVAAGRVKANQRLKPEDHTAITQAINYFEDGLECAIA